MPSEPTQKLFKLTAHCGADTHIYYVVAPSIVEAQEAVEEIHQGEGFDPVDFFDSQQLAEQDPEHCGRPEQLVISKTVLPDCKRET